MSENAPEKQVKSVITCDMEGRVETFNAGAEQIFGYSAAEVIGHKRVAIFSPGLTVLGHVGDWLKTAREEGEYTGQTVFVRKDGSTFAADIRITPTFRAGEQIGYCGVTVPRYDIPVEQVSPEISFGTRLFRWLVITRAPFLTAAIVPIVIAAAWIVASGRVDSFPWLYFVLSLIGGIALQVAANTFNDYFDWQSGTDQANNDYFQPLTGGSRSIELRLIDEPGLFRVAFGSALVAGMIGILLVILQRPLLILFGVIGLLCAYFYTAPPLKLAAHRGLGELIVGLNFGPLMTAGTIYALTGSLNWLDFFVGVPVGLLITAVLWINQFPDYAGDRKAGKINLVVALGKKTARWGYAALVFGAFIVLLAGVINNILPVGALSSLLALPLAIHTSIVTFRHYEERGLVRANSGTIMLHMLTGILFSIGLFLNSTIVSLINL
jgi:1,4-dihydroxy-2-naphthoate octaprenyltransferase